MTGEDPALHDTGIVDLQDRQRTIELVSQSILGLLLRPGFELAAPKDLEIPQCVPGAPEALAILRKSHAAWLQDAGAPAN